MKKVILYIFCFTTSICLSQKNAKPQYLIDENNQFITSDQFKSKVENRELELYAYEIDTALIARFIKKRDIGTLTIPEKTTIIEELQKISNSKIDVTKILIINFFYKDNPKPNGNCIDYYTNDKVYKKNLTKNNNLIQFFITEKDYQYKNKNVLQDTNDIIRKTLFKYKMDCGNYIIINPDGSFFRKFGEYRQDEILKMINKNM